jgi:predicted nuclease of predicted toxin-antitoxin system
VPGRFKLDENLPRDATALFTDGGHDVETVLEEGLGGEPDGRIFDVCQEEQRIFVTLDLDFADIRQYLPEKHCGVWVLRPVAQRVQEVLALLRGWLALHASESSHQHLWIIERGRVRIR